MTVSETIKRSFTGEEMELKFWDFILDRYKPFQKINNPFDELLALNNAVWRLGEPQGSPHEGEWLLIDRTLIKSMCNCVYSIYRETSEGVTLDNIDWESRRDTVTSIFKSLIFTIGCAIQTGTTKKNHQGKIMIGCLEIPHWFAEYLKETFRTDGKLQSTLRKYNNIIIQSEG